MRPGYKRDGTAYKSFVLAETSRLPIQIKIQIQVPRVKPKSWADFVLLHLNYITLRHDGTLQNMLAHTFGKHNKQSKHLTVKQFRKMPAQPVKVAAPGRPSVKTLGLGWPGAATKGLVQPCPKLWPLFHKQYWVFFLQRLDIFARSGLILTSVLQLVGCMLLLHTNS